MPQIQVITDEMHNIANGIGQRVESIRGSQGNVLRLVQGLGTGFSGNLPSLMIQYVSSKRFEYQTIINTLNAYRSFVDWAADNYDWTDQQLAQWGNAGNSRGWNIPNQPQPSNPNPPSAPTGGWDTSGGWDTVGSTFPTNRPDLDSKYYDTYVYANKYLSDEWYAQHPYTKQYVDGVRHINCVAYARKRALEVNQMDTYQPYPNSGSGTEIRSNSVAYYHNSKGLAHAVYVEHYDEATQTVYFTEGNWGREPDGRLKTLSLDEFKSRQGWHIANYDYYPPA